MSGIGGIIHWDDRPIDERRLAAMMRLIQHRGPDGLNWEIRGQAGLGSARFSLRHKERTQKQPVWRPDGAIGIVADARIYNADELKGRLNDVSWLSEDPSDAELILGGYERWGQEVVQHLDGDFAFVVWDARSRKAFSAKDPFGVKPLYYHWSPRGFFFGSEVKQVLLAAGLPAEPDDMIVGEYLFTAIQTRDRTFFKGIARLKPGNLMVLQSDKHLESRFWLPDPSNLLRLQSPEDYYERFRQLLKRSVAKRLSSDYSVAAHLSGGLDSSSIVFLASELYRHQAENLPSFQTISLVYPGLDCDESLQIQSAVRRLTFECHIASPLDKSALDGLMDAFWRVDGPFVYAQRVVDTVSHEVLRKIGARKVLVGFGGDELAQESGFLEELAARRKLLRWLAEARCLSRIQRVPLWNTLRQTGGPALPPWVKKPLRPFFNRRWRPPAWVRPSFLAFYLSCPEVASEPVPAFHSRVQRSVFLDLCHPYNIQLLDVYSNNNAYQGVEGGYPFLDRSLAEFVLSVPFEQRTLGGRWKNLIRGAMKDVLPHEILERERKVVFDSHVHYVIRKDLPILAAMLFDNDGWHSERFLARADAFRLFSDPNYAARTAFDDRWTIAMVELWHRQLVRYNEVADSSGMEKKDENGERI